MNKLIIIGNGFDLAHGLPTKYTDFIKWLIKKEIENSESKEYSHKCDISNNLFRITWSPKLGNHLPQYYKFIKSQSSIEDVLKNVDFQKKQGKDISLDYSSTFIEKLCQKRNENWMDIEKLYYEELKKIYNKLMPNDGINRLNDNFKYIKMNLEAYLSTLETKEMIDMSSILQTPKQQNTIINIDYVINFNYTDTVKRYLKDGLIDSINIHGQINDEENEIIFGYGDELDPDYKNLERLDDNRFLSNIKSVSYMKTKNYSRLINLIDGYSFCVYILGHSCGLSDRTLLNTIFEHKNCNSIKVFYYQYEDNNQKQDNFLEISTNIIRHFDDKKLMRNRLVNKTECIPMPQLEKSLP